jgi:hypothetical protein
VKKYEYRKSISLVSFQSDKYIWLRHFLSIKPNLLLLYHILLSWRLFLLFLDNWTVSLTLLTYHDRMYCRKIYNSYPLAAKRVRKTRQNSYFILQKFVVLML